MAYMYNLNKQVIKKVVLLLMCFLALSSNPAHAKREQIVLGTSIIDQNPNIPGKGKAPMRIPIIYIDGYTLSNVLDTSQRVYNDNAQTRTNYQYCLETATFTK
jgi:hypothetical protein